MSVRITGGRLRSRRVEVPPVRAVRPTPARVREALFSVLGQDLTGWSVLDACAGAGLLGFEAASRGAGPLTMADLDRRVVAHLRRAAGGLGLEDVELLRLDAHRLLAREDRSWDLVLLDPPYADDPAAWARAAAPRVDRVLVVEHRQDRVVPGEVDGLVLDRTRRYGDTAISLWRRETPRGG